MLKIILSSKKGKYIIPLLLIACFPVVIHTEEKLIQIYHFVNCHQRLISVRKPLLNILNIINQATEQN